VRKANFLSVLIEQSALSGTINFIPYRYLLDAQLTNERLTVSFIKPLVDIPVNMIREVKPIKTITMFGIKITYQAKPHLLKVFYLRTRKYQQWANAFAALGITVQAPSGWFDFDLLDYFRQ
jgi:hypothetical protein